ncbi:hypothetical protein [Halosolutus halophilus]|uniref:hypothetical protein n=1 Tax=Halosolutus halophilus TaxID=1552990 RepID=UPI002234EF38|nr:hypothetical protein [Halosolutus halophilus]
MPTRGTCDEFVTRCVVRGFGSVGAGRGCLAVRPTVIQDGAGIDRDAGGDASGV